MGFRGEGSKEGTTRRGCRWRRTVVCLGGYPERVWAAPAFVWAGAAGLRLLFRSVAPLATANPARHGKRRDGKQDRENA